MAKKPKINKIFSCNIQASMNMFTACYKKQFVSRVHLFTNLRQIYLREKFELHQSELLML